MNWAKNAVMSSIGGAFFVAALTSMSVLGGCSSDEGFTSKTARKNLSPAMETLALSKEQRKNRSAYTTDVNLRQLNDDWDSILLLDRPMYLTRSPMP